MTSSGNNINQAAPEAPPNKRTITLKTTLERTEIRKQFNIVKEKVFPNTPLYRLERDDFWIKTLNTKKPKDLILTINTSFRFSFFPNTPAHP